MNPSLLLKELLVRAEELRHKCGAPCLSAPLLLTAMAEKCATPYEGLTPLDDKEVEPFEEERLRYLFRRVFRGGGQLLARFYQKDRGYDTADFLQSQAPLLKSVMEQRGKTFLTADLAFLAAVSVLPSEHRPTVMPEFKNDFSVAALLAETDGEIYDYVIAEIGALQQKLQKKAARAKELRDWRPAAKFMEPEALEAAFYKSLQIRKEEKQLLLPHFFGKDEPLALTFGFSEECYYVHDNGSALSLLHRRENFDAIFERIRKNLSAEGDRIVGAFSQPWGFFHYLQTLIFAAHGDLYWQQLSEQGLHCDPGISFPAESEPFDFDLLLGILRENLTFGYNENNGLTLSIGMHYSINSHRIAYGIESLPHSICIRDAYAGKLEGEILESFYWGHEDLRAYRAHIEPYLSRFGGELSEKDLCLRAPKEDWIVALFRFFNLAVLCSELGRLIDLPEVVQ